MPTAYIGFCPRGYMDSEVVSRCLHGSTALVFQYSLDTGYKNIDCMICNDPGGRYGPPLCYWPEIRIGKINVSILQYDTIIIIVLAHQDLWIW